MGQINTSKFTQATLCFLVKGDEVLLAEKQKKIGAGFLNGFGGKYEPEDKTIEQTNIREVEEEVRVIVKSAKKMGEMIFKNPSDDDTLKNMVVHIFIATKWDGDPVETDEMKKIAWYKISDLDYDKFLSADRLFIPQILSGKFIKGIVEYGYNWQVESSQIDEVDFDQLS
jgi:8-oxo-dGTP diphosphatase